ncbi:hypothetical protein [Desulfogranum mediterraneum]|uniref:hypothetical protein n=1 Tax=Desulfogranum mediterraneum TaxID=160661 RepID=UPI00048A89BD|nr:hypothetical protein [Desulfogranum mediterraneum]
MRFVQLVLFVMVVLLAGCAGFNLDAPKGVVDNTFYSSKFPRIMVEVEETLHYQQKENNRELALGSNLRRSTHVEQDLYAFVSEDKKSVLVIRVERLRELNWYMNTPDYSQQPNCYASGTESLAGVRFSTGISAVRKKNHTLLLKSYGAVFGDAILLQIFYAEEVADSWAQTTSLQSKEKAAELEAFNQRAGRSFTVGDYREPAALAASN